MVQSSAAWPKPDVYQAIQEPTRRRILDMLAEGEASVVRIASPLSDDMTRPAVSQHLKVLKDAGLVSARRVGRENLYRLEAQPLREVFDWLSFYERFWTGHLNALGKYLDQQAQQKKKKKHKPPRK